METVLVVGATGNIGTAAIIGALRSGLKVLAIVRNENSAAKLFRNIGSKEGITTVQADVTSETGVRTVVDQVKAGKLPAFQHVYCAAGGSYSPTPLLNMTTEGLRAAMNQNFESNFFAYRETIPYLLEQKNPNSTWTLCSGAQGDFGERPEPAMTQGAVYSLCTAACRDNEKTNIRFNEVYLAMRVEVDADAEKSGMNKASDFAANYEQLLSRKDIRSCRVNVFKREDYKDLKFKPKRLDLQYV